MICANISLLKTGETQNEATYIRTICNTVAYRILDGKSICNYHFYLQNHINPELLNQEAIRIANTPKESEK